MNTLSYNIPPEKLKNFLINLSLENSLLYLKLNFEHHILSLTDIEALTLDDLHNSSGQITSGNTLCSFKYDRPKHRLEIIILKKRFDTPYVTISQGIRELIESL